MAFSLRVSKVEQDEHHERLFTQQEVLVGRDEGTDLRLESGAVSLVHLSLQQTESCLLVEDRGSTNGTTLDEVPLAPGVPTPIGPHSVLTLGPFKLEVLRIQTPRITPAQGGSVHPAERLLTLAMAFIVLLAAALIAYLLLS